MIRVRTKLLVTMAAILVSRIAIDAQADEDEERWVIADSQRSVIRELLGTPIDAACGIP